MNHGPLDVLVPTSRTISGGAVPFSEIALTGVYEISKILASPNRLETTLSNVMGLLWSFMQMRHGLISLLADDGVPDIVVGAGWSEGSDARYRARLPELAIGQIIATGVPLVAQNIAGHPLFSEADVAAMQGGDDATVSFIGVPIRIGAKVVGTLTIDRIWDGKAVFRFDVDVRFLTMVANLIGQTVQLHRVVARDRDRLIAETHRLQKQLSELKAAEPTSSGIKISGIVGDSPAIRSVLRKIEIVAKSSSPVLLRGESGTGKELFARAIHEMSPRAEGPFIKVNCAALPESVLESELFGHEKGAFTGALNARKGRFELADKGTLFLDEIGEISPAFQAKLLRVLQESEFERVGGTRTIKVDVRIVTATNRNLEEAVARNDFRADLYYRISVVPLLLPPLRERKSDIPLLAQAFLGRFNSENDRELSFAPGALEVLSNCYFPGNVRELENCVRRTATLAHGPVITRDDFACRLDQCLSSVLWRGQATASANRPLPEIPLPVAPQPQPYAAQPQPFPLAPAPAPPPTYAPPPPQAYAPPPEIPAQMPPMTAPPAPPEMPLSPYPPVEGHRGAAERERLLDAMERSGWVQAKAARILGITPRQIGYALKKHGIPIKRF